MTARTVPLSRDSENRPLVTLVTLVLCDQESSCNNLR